MMKRDNATMPSSSVRPSQGGAGIQQARLTRGRGAGEIESSADLCLKFEPVAHAATPSSHGLNQRAGDLDRTLDAPEAYDCIDDEELAAFDLAAVTANSQLAGTPAAPTEKPCQLAAATAGHSADAARATCALSGGKIPTDPSGGSEGALQPGPADATSCNDATRARQPAASAAGHSANALGPQPPRAEPVCALWGGKIRTDPSGGT